MTNSTEPSKSDDLLRLLLRHVISLGWIDNYPHDEPGYEHLRISTDCRLQFITGFLYEFRGELCMMTAGHVIKDLNALIKDKWRIESMSIQDGWGHGAKRREPIPFNYDPGMTIGVHQDDKVDFGIIHLREGYRKQLEANRGVPFQKKNWEAQPNEYDRYIMVGFPVQGGSVPKAAHLMKEFKAKVTAVCIDVVCDQNPPDELLTNAPRFYGRLSSLDAVPIGSKTLTDIDGMSGGLIIGLKKINEQWQYWPVAIQSGWVKSKRAIAGTYLTLAGLMLERMMEEHLRQRASGEIPEQLPE